MDLRQLEELLHKYTEGNTTHEEEQLLREALTGADVPEKFKPLADMFAFFEKETKQAPLSKQFDDQLLEKIQNPRQIGWLWKISGAAAAVLLTVSLTYMAFNREEIPVVAEDTYSDPRQAFEETKKALMMLSDRFNEGAKHVEKLETFHEVQEEITIN